MDKAQRKIFRSPSVKRKNKGLQILQKLTLERVLGLTVTSNAALSCDPNTGTIAYPAGCVVVLFNPRRNRQSHIFNTTKKTITSVAFSCDGKHLVTGECGHQPAVRVWDVSEKTQIAEFHGHKFGINCVAFSPNLKYIVSVGSQYDMMVNVWNWRTGNKVASNKVSCKVCAVAFSTDSGYFVTVGNRHVKFWYLDCNKSKINQTVPLLGRSGILGEQRNNFFSDVVCGRGPSASSTFVITQSGLLCEFNEKRLLDKWVELRTKSANCLTAGEEHIYVGCAEGVVRVFSANSLHFVTTLPHPHHLGVEVATATSSSDMICTRTDAKYPDTIAIAIDDHCKVACIYNDHSLYVWDVVNVRRVGKAWSFLYHSGCIWALEVYPRLESPQTGVLPPGSFITSSSDDTIRVWNLDSQMSETAEYKRNIYSNELLKVIYTDPSLAYLCDVNFNPAGATDKTDTTWEGKNGVRSIRVSPDGEHLASGDRQGNVRIYDMHQMAEIRSIEAHESDVVCLEYSFSKAGPRILASGSRDRLIHVFDVEQKYGLLQTLDDHSAAIQAVRFTDANNRLRMLSCGSDKSLLFRNVNLNPSFEFVLDQHLVSKATMYDMIIDPTQKFVATACQDRNIRVYNMATAKQKKNYRASCGDEGVLLRVQLDPSGTYAATSCSDKNLCILEFYTGEIICSVNGHSEISTGLRFTNDLKHLISVSADGCIFVWRLPSDMTKTMRLRMEELGKLPQEDSSIDLRREVTLMPNPVTLDISFQDLQHFPVMKENISPARVLSYMAGSATPKGKGTTNSVQPSPADYCFSIGPLPNWAKIRFGDSTGEGIDGNADALQPKGRWAQRFDQNMAFKSQLDLTQLDDEIDRTSEGKLSVSRQTSLPDLRRETVVLSQQHLPLKNIPIIDDDDETNVDDDEEFLPAYFSSQSSNINVESDRSSSDYGDKKSKHRSDSAGRPIDATTTGRNLGSRLSLSLDKTNTNSFDLDDTDDPDSWSDTTEVIYPPNDAETLDTYASTYKVFAVDENGSHSKVRAKQTTLSSPTADEGDSESTDPVSLEDHEDEDAVDDTMITSTASTPSDPEREFPRTPDKEQFVKENFETDAFTPLPIDKFHQQMATLERAADVIDPSNLPFSPRLSLSSRFLSRSQFGIRSLGRVAQRSDDWYDPLRKSKSEIARAMDETRRRLTDINWHSNDVLKNSPEKEDPPSPPTKLENNEPNFSSSPKVSIVSSIASTKGEADNIKSTSVTSPNHIRSTVTARERRRSIIGSRTGEVTSSGSTRSGEVTGGTGTRTGEHSSNSSAAVRQVPSYFRTTKSSRLKSASSSNLMGPFDSQSAKSTVISNKAETGVKKKTGRSRLSSSNHLALYASTPNLTVYHEEVDDIERAIQKTSNLKTLTELSLSVPDINALDDLKSTDSSSPSLPVTGFKDSAGVKQTIKTCSPSVISRLAPDKLANTDFHMDDSGLSNPRSVFQPPNSELMPPPPIGTPLKSTQTNFLRRSVQIRNRSTAELTLEQAKSILLGNSGILCRQTSNEDVPLTSTLPNKKNTYTKSSGTLQKNIPCSKTLTSPLSSLTNVSSHANSTSSSVFEPLETDTLPETGFTSATTLAVAEEIERTASRLRRERVAATALGAARYDPPERDRPQTHKVVNPIKIITSSHSHGASLDKNKEGGKALDRNKEGGKALDKNKEDGKALDKNKEGEKALDLRLSVSPTTKESEELTVKERVARFNQQTVTQTTVEVSHPIHNSIGLSPRNIRVTTSSPLPPDFLGSPRSQSDTGLGSETDTDSEPRHHQVSGLGSSLSRVNRSHLSLHLHNSASPSSTASSASSTASAASDHGVPTESLQICTSILADLRQAVQRAKEFHTQVHSGGSNTVGYQQMMVLMSEAFHEAHLTLAHLALQSPVLPESSTKPPSCPLVEVTGSWDQTVMEKAQDMLQPFVSQLSQELSDELVKLVKDKLQGNPQ